MKTSRSISTTAKHLRRSPYQAIAAVLILSLTFFAVSVFTLLMSGSYLIMRHFEAAPQVIAFFERGRDVPDEDRLRIQEKLETTGKLATFKYVSPKEAEAIYRERNKEDPLLLELVDYKILPPSIEISATEIGYLSELKSVLEDEPLVKDIVFFEDIVNSLSTWVRNLRLIGMVTISFLLLLSTLIVVVIVSMKVKGKKTEIGILRLLGAGGWFIQGPFVWEGIFYGATGAFLGWIGSYILLLYATPFLVEWLAEVELLPVNPLLMLALLGVELVLGAVVGAFAGWLAARRFLHI